jgi:hypothetical protein
MHVTNMKVELAQEHKDLEMFGPREHNILHPLFAASL